MTKIAKLWVLIPLLLIPGINVHAWPIPDTGQTKCYNNTAEITCPLPGQPFYGQNGNYKINPPSYTKLGAAGEVLSDDATIWSMVRDNITGLIWENKTNDSSIHDGTKTFTWCDTNTATNGGNQGICGTGTGNAATDTEAYIKALNDATFGGFSDWRLPSVKELESIVDLSKYSPAINTAWFPNTVPSYYWSSTTYAYYVDYAWWVSFNYGYVSADDKANAYAVRAVRGVQSGLLDHLLINGDGTVTDTDTGLMWQQGTSPESMTWEAALTYSEGLSLAGYDDWRLPTLRELESIVDYGRSYPSIDTTAFPSAVSSEYWSSTASAFSSGNAWCVYFSNGPVVDRNKASAYAVRAVRGGTSKDLIMIIASMFTKTQLDQAVADANAAKDLIIAQKDQTITTLNTTISSKDQTIASMFTKQQLDQAVVEERIKWDINNDGKRGLEEVIYILQTLVGLRPPPAGMVLIPAGSFQMGDAIDGMSESMPVHPVTVNAFYLDQYEVTKALWDEVYTWATAHGYSFDYAGAGMAANHPVQDVYWYDVVKWLNARSEKEGRQPVYYTDSGQTTVYRTGQVDVAAEAVKWSSNGYRLPTEAEWEYAARAGTTMRFFTGSCISTDQANYDGNYPESGCPAGQFRGGTTAVGSFAPNLWGLYDMAGNVWEWTWDWYDAYPSSAMTNPRGPDSAWGRVVRGGCWLFNAGKLRSAFRSYNSPSFRGSSTGFRSARSQL
jgi:formylglycine-generating enzyme required for sulfatase activity